MSYYIEIIKRNLHKTSEWSGGTTTELYVYPKYATYNERNFKWRLSSAKVEVEKSTFTYLPGITRLIMIIEGELLLEHEGHHSSVLKSLEQDGFSGEWLTTSFGKVIDFNLMMAQGCRGSLEAISIKGGSFKEILLQDNISDMDTFNQITEAFYIVKGDAIIITEAENQIILNEGDLALVTIKNRKNDLVFKICNCGDEKIKIIRSTIFY